MLGILAVIKNFRPGGETLINHCFTYKWASNEVKILGHKRKVDLLPITPVADLIIAPRSGFIA